MDWRSSTTSAQLQNDNNITSPVFVPKTEEEKSVIRDQLDRVLAHPCFRNSVRSQNFLRYIIEHSLHNEPGQLKERIVGIEAFGRPADYDTSRDSVVRSTASETRKRLAQYYRELECKDEIQFEIPPGAYYAEFHFPGKDLAESIEPSASSPPIVFSILRKGWVALILAATIVAAMAGLSLWGLGNSKLSAGTLLRIENAAGFLNPNLTLLWEPLELFWRPVWNSPDSVLICVGESQLQSQKSDVDTGHSDASYVALSSTSAVANLSGLLGRAHKQFRLKTVESMTYDDLRGSSAILIGGLDNSWTVHSTENLRFRIVRAQPPGSSWIEDYNNKESKTWSISSAQDSKDFQDYAIVGRFLDPSARTYVMVAAGLGKDGTEVAGEFLVDPAYIRELTKSLPRNWPSKNIEIVIATRVVDGNPGPPRVLAVDVW